MFKLNRATEYGLIALRHMDAHPQVTSAREIADAYGLPFEMTAKTLQRLKDSGLIQSEQGARGGYTLNRKLQDVTLAEFLEKMEGQQAVVACLPSSCDFDSKCNIRGPMADLNRRLIEFLGGIRLADLERSPMVTLSAFSGEEP